MRIYMLLDKAHFKVVVVVIMSDHNNNKRPTDPHCFQPHSLD